ncbi:MAG: MBL fold metallo-hydrolase [Candidatus Cloacimonetes bacterium]|nr:MBL fold metallo-hydrolase [Candidatus Cloacimonadota bacterium]
MIIRIFVIVFVAVILGSCAYRQLINICDIEISDDQKSEGGKIKPIYNKGKYINPFPPDEPNNLSIWKVHFAKNKAQTRPQKSLDVTPINTTEVFPADDKGLYITWLGHSSILMQIEGIKIFIDPVFSDNISPIPFVKLKRYQKTAALKGKDIKELDLVVISHNHYDHLDKKAIKELKSITKLFITPKGVSKYLEKWGVNKDKILELSWWEEWQSSQSEYRNFSVVCTPARHFSGRSLSSINKSLWASFVFIGENHRVFYSGDTSFNYHFDQIGHHYGPFDVTLMECGQYNKAWTESHLMPEETIKAHKQVKGNYLLPIHWGSFTLSKHDCWEPAERVLAAAPENNVKIITPTIGQTIKGKTEINTFEWWKDLK